MSGRAGVEAEALKLDLEVEKRVGERNGPAVWLGWGFFDVGDI